MSPELELFLIMIGIGNCCIFAMALGSYVCFQIKRKLYEWITGEKIDK